MAATRHGITFDMVRVVAPTDATVFINGEIDIRRRP
jgi:hypothetical protein